MLIRELAAEKQSSVSSAGDNWQQIAWVPSVDTIADKAWYQARQQMPDTQMIWQSGMA
jgi:hypothetical protein